MTPFMHHRVLRAGHGAVLREAVLKTALHATIIMHVRRVLPGRFPPPRMEVIPGASMTVMVVRRAVRQLQAQADPATV